MTARCSAKECFRLCLDLEGIAGPEAAYANAGLAEAFLSEGKLDEARSCWENAVELGSGYGIGELAEAQLAKHWS